MERLNSLRDLDRDNDSDDEMGIPEIPRTLQIVGYLHDYLARLTTDTELNTHPDDQ